MSLDIRDYLAAHAPGGALATAQLRAAHLTGVPVFNIEIEAPMAVMVERAKMAYEWADAMLKVRDERCDPHQNAFAQGFEREVSGVTS